jgi:Lrp/AsnC family leucine-responsive transcriptional regulator
MPDEISLNILKILQQKARIPNAEVARQINLAPSAVLERIRKLEKQGIIDGYEVILNPEYFNRTFIAFVHVYLNDLSKVSKAGKQFSEIPDVQEVHYITGKDCFLLKIRTKNSKELNNIIKTSIYKTGFVDKTETSVSLESFRETALFPIETL